MIKERLPGQNHILYLKAHWMSLNGQYFAKVFDSNLGILSMIVLVWKAQKP